MRTRSFTIIEILVAVIIIGILVTLVLIPAYQSAIDASQERVCEANLQALKTALDIYAMEHDVMPGSLSELSDSYTRRAYAHVMKEYNGYNRIMVNLAAAIVSWDERGRAYAQNFMRQYLTKGDLKTMTCPADTTPPPGGVSYGLNANLAGISTLVYRSLPADIILIGDCDVATFNNVAGFSYRHSMVGGNGKTKAITRGGTLLSAREDEGSGGELRNSNIHISHYY
jgi:competence protein ComGC